jgi:hypothetical protein
MPEASVDEDCDPLRGKNYVSGDSDATHYDGDVLPEPQTTLMKKRSH